MTRRSFPKARAAERPAGLRLLHLATLALALLIAAALSAQAASPALQDARRACAVAEGEDGLLHMKGGASQDVRSEVARINQQRQAAYAQIAARNGATVAMTAEITGAKVIERLPRGQCYRTKAGKWVKK
ncbi:MAG: YdbL family protein [Pseudomonadota bacterium]